MSPQILLAGVSLTARTGIFFFKVFFPNVFFFFFSKKEWRINGNKVDWNYNVVAIVYIVSFPKFQNRNNIWYLKKHNLFVTIANELDTLCEQYCDNGGNWYTRHCFQREHFYQDSNWFGWYSQLLPPATREVRQGDKEKKKRNNETDSQADNQTDQLKCRQRRNQRHREKAIQNDREKYRLTDG